MKSRRALCFMAAGVCVLAAAQSAAADAISVAWDPSASPQINGYAVYVGTQSGAYSQRYDVGGSTLFTLSSAIAGQRYCFAVAAYENSLESPKSSEVCGFSNAPPSLVNPGTQSSTAGQPVTLQLLGTDPASQPLTYNATGLPPGLSVMGSTGMISGSGTTAGTYTVTASASDGVLSASQSFSWTMTTAPVADATAPTVTISGPTSSATFSTTTASMALSGASTDNKGVTQVSWMSDRGGSGIATGTTSWSVSSIGLFSGANVITVIARDAAGNQGSGVLTVTYTAAAPPPPPPPPPAPAPAVSILLFGEPVTSGMRRQVRLTWTQAPWTGVWVYRNGSRIDRTTNDGSWIDGNINKRTTSSDYRICAPGGSPCSNTITAYF